MSNALFNADYALANLKGLDAQVGNLIRKSSTPTLGLELVRQDLEDDLKLAANLKIPLRNRLNRIKGQGKAHAFYQLQSNLDSTGTVNFLGTDATQGVFAKGGLPNSSDPQYNYIARPYANVGDVLTVPWQDQAQDESYIDIKAQQKKVKMLNTALMEEWLIINGDSATSNGLAFDGLISQIQSGGYNVLDVSAGGGSGLRYPLIQQVLYRIQKAGGNTTAMIMSYALKEALTLLLGELYAIRQMEASRDGKVRGGFEVDSWNFGTGSVELIYDQYMIPDPVTGYERIIFLDDESPDEKNGGNVVQMVDVDPIHYAELATIATADRGIVYETTQLQIGVLQFQGILEGINLSLTSSLT